MKKFDITLRPAESNDNEFIYRVYASTREDELKQTNWEPQQLNAFLKMQFTAQDRHYRDSYPGAEFLVILNAGIPAGRLYLHRHPEELRIMDISLLPEHRKKGIGTFLLRNLQLEAKESGQPLTLHVQKENPALSLYLSLDFQVAGDKGVYLFMKWTS